MKTRLWITTTAVAIALIVAIMAPATTFAAQSSRPKNKNTWRNLAIGSSVVAGYGLLHHNTAATVFGVAGVAYSANRDEQERRSQSKARQARANYLRHHQNYHLSTDYTRNGKKYYRCDGHSY